MIKEKKKAAGFPYHRLPLMGVLLLMLLAAVLLLHNSANNQQAIAAVAAQVRFEGEYRIGDGPWQTIVQGKHISSTRGDVTLRGYFHMLTPDGEYVGLYTGDMPIAFYTDHIGVTVREEGCEPWEFDIENPLFGASSCGAYWNAYTLSTGGASPVEIRIHNPHRFGNEKAVDELLSGMALWAGIDFERSMMDEGLVQRNSGLAFVITSMVLLGFALLSGLLHLPDDQIIWMLGATGLSAGVYLAYSAPGVSFWSEFRAWNTSILGFSMMFYMLFILGIVTKLLASTHKIGRAVTGGMGTVVGLCFLLPVVTEVRFYDTWLPWAVIQSGANVIMLVCILREFRGGSSRKRLIHGGMAMQMLAFEADAVGTVLGIWKGGVASRYVYIALYVVALFATIWVIPESIRAADKARELEIQKSRLESEKNRMEAELKESRVSLLLSQIRPHFIYNTLGTIERMCLKDPQEAFKLVRNFSLYLRGNFSELDSVAPIRFSEELKHVEYYVNIEKVRFPDMSIEYDVETTDFVLPALTVQPLVENAIKHGLMRLESGGTVVIRSYETPTHFCVEVTDDGVGFDITQTVEDKKHVGLRNIRGRLNAMVNGELILESKVGVGTKAVIMIPKE